MIPAHLIPDLKRRCAMENFSECTIKNYTESVERFLKWCSGNEKDTIIENVEEWILHLRWAHKLAPASINLHSSAVRFYCATVLKSPIAKGVIPRMKEKKELPEPMTAEEVKKLFSCENNLKHLALLQVAYYGGLRLGDIQKLKVGDIRFDRGLVHVQDGKGMKDRFVMLPDCVHDILKNIIGARPGSDYVFISQQDQGQYPKRTIQRIFENACERAGIPGRHNIHRLRHSYACNALKAGMDIRTLQETMGHSSITTTQKYVKITATDISKNRNILSLGDN
jgi:integrase/recombinase XerD